jgi:repressor of nif and glnA expression
MIGKRLPISRIEFNSDGYDSREVERKVISILRILSDSPQHLGARLIARQLKEHGVELNERG